jgi:hypothetical protein
MRNYVSKYIKLTWLIFVLVVAMFAVSCLPDVPVDPTVPTTTPTGTTTPSAGCTPVPSGQDDSGVIQALLKTCSVIVIKEPMMVNKEIKIIEPNKTITWQDSGLFYRDIQAGQGITLSFLQVESTGLTLNNVQLRGPNPKKVFTPGARAVCGYYTPLEHQHGITFHGAKQATVNGGRISNLHGDGIYIDLQSQDVTLNNLTIDCVGRTTVTNLGSTRTKINGGTFTTAVWWIFNIELQGETVTDYYIDRPNIGYSRLEFLLASCPYGGSYSGVVINKPTFLAGANPIWKSICGDARVIL